MAGILQALFGGSKPSATPSTEDSDFAEFAGATSTAVAPSADYTPWFGAGPPGTVTYTKWYRVWERASPKDFVQEAFIIPTLLIVVALHFWGRRSSRRKARNWAAAHAPLLQKEYARVGFGESKTLSLEDLQSDDSGAKSMTSESMILPEELIKEKTSTEFISYATGRQNAAFTDFKIQLYNRSNPLQLFAEWLLSLFFESFKSPAERMEAMTYTFDGREKDLVPVRTEQEQTALETRVKGLQSSYDGFVWAVVHKDTMRRLREDRYDISLTFTKDHPKLPSWATVMSESAEITEQLLTDDLVKAIEEAGSNAFENLIITDQPVEKPLKLNDAQPRKRLALSLRLPSSSSQSAYVHTIPIFGFFLRLPDYLASSAHYRPEVLRRIKATREEELRKLRKQDDEEKAEERKLDADKKKKEERDKRLKGLSADEQRKYLEKEREKEQRKQQKKMTRKG